MNMEIRYEDNPAPSFTKFHSSPRFQILAKTKSYFLRFFFIDKERQKVLKIPDR